MKSKSIFRGLSDFRRNAQVEIISKKSQKEIKGGDIIITDGDII